MRRQYSTHLHQSLIEDAKITSFNYFGCRVKPEVAAKNLGENVYLMGNIDPMLMLQGTVDQVADAAQDALKWLAPLGCFMLGDGANICPGTPIKNLAALSEAAKNYGLPHDPIQLN